MEGSKSFSVRVPKEDVLDIVKTSAYYTGEARKGIEGMLKTGTQIQASSDEDVALGDAFEEGAGKLCAVLTRAAGPTSYASEQFLIHAQANFNDTLTDSLAQNCRTYMTDYVLYKWLLLMKPDEAGLYAERLGSDEQNIVNIACERKKPQRS